MDKHQKEVLDIIKKINLEYQRETEYWLQTLYHLILHDRVSLDDVCDIGERYGLDIESSYNELMNTFEDNDEQED